MDIPPEHKILDIAQHLSAYILGVVAVTGAIIRFWWKDRVLIRNKIDENMDKVTFEIKKLREDNVLEHKDIIETMNRQHSETIEKMFDLHSK